MLATQKQIAILRDLTARIDIIRMRHPSLVPQGWERNEWDIDMTSDKASARIDYYKEILRQCDLILYPHKQVAETEDLPA